MCPNKNIIWQITSNSVRNRMIDNSLIHTFVSSRKIRKRTKVLNTELKKYCSVTDYKEYIDLKTNILRNLEEDPDTDDPGYLTDIDYSIIYSSDSTQAKYVAERTKKYSFTSDVNYKAYKSKNNTKNTKHKEKKKSKNTEVQNKHREQRNKTSQTKHNTSNKHINIGWQEVVRQRDVSHLYDNRISTNISNNERNTFESKKCNSLTLQSNNQFFSQRLTSQSSTLFNTKKSINRKTRKNNRNSNVMINKLHSEDNTISNVTEITSENNVPNYEHQNIVLNDSNSELDSQSSHYNATPSKSAEKINDFNNELNSITQNSEDNIVSSKIEVFNKSKEQICGHQDAVLNESNAELELQSLHNVTPSKSTENINDFDNEVNPVTPNFENGIISSKIEVFDESKEQIYGHQDAVLNESNAELESQSSRCKVTPSKSTENINDFNNKLNPITSNSEDNIIPDKIEVSNESKVQIDVHQDTALNESNAELDTQSPHCKATLSKSTENINDTNLITLEENNSDKLTQANNKNLINTDNCNSYMSYKSKLLKNVRRNLTPVLEEVNFTNNEKNINTDKNRENGLNHDQLHLSTVNSSRHSIPLKKKQINVHEMCNSSPDTSLLDQQKDSGFDDDSQDKFVKIKKSNIKSPMSRNTEEKILVSPEHPKKITNVPDTTDLKDFKEDISDIHLKNCDNCLKEQNNKEVTESTEEKEIKNSSSNKDVELSTINQEGKTHFVKVEKLCNIKKQHLLSPKQDRTKADADSKLHGHILEKQDNKTIKKFHEKEEIKNLQLNQGDKDAEISINQKGKTHFVKKEDLPNTQKQLLSPKRGRLKDTHSKSDNNITEEQSSKNKEMKKSFDEEEVKNSLELSQIHKDAKISTKEDKMHIVKSESDIQKQSLLSSKKECTKNEHSKSYTNILDERDNKEVKESSEKEVESFYQSSQIDKDMKISSINKHEAHTKLKDECDTKKLQLPKITCTEIINTKYKIINKKFNSDIEEVDNINGTSEHTPVNNNTLINCSNVDWQDKVTDVKEIDNNISMMMETDNEEEDTYHVSPQTQKRLQQQAKLNLVVNSDSSESDSEAKYITETSRKFIDNSDANSSLNKEIVCNKSNQSEYSVFTDNLETSCRSGLDIFYCERPYNLQQLVEDQKLLVETLPVSFTLADISDDDEAFILNIPNKVLQYNLQDELLTIKGDTIKFGKNKYKIVRKKVGTTSCVFATGKKRKPYKIVNINEISTVTVRERLPPYAEKSDILTSHSNEISTKSKSPKINNRQTAKRDSKILEVSDHKRKRFISDFEIKQSAVKKKRLKVNHS